MHNTSVNHHYQEREFMYCMRPKNFSGWKVLLSLLMVWFLAGCGDSMNQPSNQPQPPARTFYDKAVQPIFTNNCANRGCHPGGGAPFSLAPGESYANLVNVHVTNGACTGTTLRVKPLFADSSVLIQRFNGACGLALMPLGSAKLDQSLIDSVGNWINRGANKTF
jgi:hypothetical protein